jgi:hypothetical protein
MEKSSIEVFTDIQNMMNKVLIWNSITFFDWMDTRQIESAKEFVAICLDFLTKNSNKFNENSYFSNNELADIYSKYDVIEKIVSSYYSSMDKYNLMKNNQQLLAIIFLFREIPVKKEIVTFLEEKENMNPPKGERWATNEELESFVPEKIETEEKGIFIVDFENEELPLGERFMNEEEMEEVEVNFAEWLKNRKNKNGQQ